MSTGAIVGVVAVIVVVLVVVALVVNNQMRSRRLKERFGDEYDRTLREQPKREAERELVRREQRHEKLHIRPLDPDARDRYSREWAEVQGLFVDRPGEAVERADTLVTALMADCGYPVDGDAEQRSADLSVRHASTVENYRLAREVRTRHADGNVSTEELRESIVHYRTLFDDLLGDGVESHADERERRPHHAADRR